MTTPAPPRALLFDLDGTLVDSVADLAESANFTRAHYDLPSLASERVGSFVGDGVVWLLRRSLAEVVDQIDLDDALRIFRAHYLEHCLDRTGPFPGVREGLQRLRPLPMALVTNKPQAMADKIISAMGWASVLPVVVGSRSGVPTKPETDMLELALRSLGLSNHPESTVWMVGDGANDVLSGKKLGCTTVAVEWGLTPQERLIALEPDLLVASFAQVVEAAGR